MNKHYLNTNLVSFIGIWLVRKDEHHLLGRAGITLRITPNVDKLTYLPSVPQTLVPGTNIDAYLLPEVPCRSMNPDSSILILIPDSSYVEL